MPLRYWRKRQLWHLSGVIQRSYINRYFLIWWPLHHASIQYASPQQESTHQPIGKSCEKAIKDPGDLRTPKFKPRRWPWGREGLKKKQCAPEKKKKLQSYDPLAPKAVAIIEERQFHEVLEGYDIHTTDRCETGEDCCALRILGAKPDFANEISLLEQIVCEAGHQVIFYPKFYCGLNYIEYYWAAVKQYTRENCSYDIHFKNMSLWYLLHWFKVYSSICDEK